MTPRRSGQTNQQAALFGTLLQGNEPRIPTHLIIDKEGGGEKERGGKGGIGDEINASFSRWFPRKAYVSIVGFTNGNSWIGDASFFVDRMYECFNAISLAELSWAGWGFPLAQEAITNTNPYAGRLKMIG